MIDNSQLKIRATLSYKPITQKAKNDEESKEWYKSISYTEPIELTIREFVYMTGQHSYSFNPAVYKDLYIKKVNLIQSQAIILDIDGKLKPVDVLNRLKKYELPPPNGIYLTLSDMSLKSWSKGKLLHRANKFRVIFILSDIVTDINDYDELVKYNLQYLFPEADPVSCVQNFYGGRKVIYFQDNELLNLLHLMSVADILRARRLKTDQSLNKKFKKNKINSCVFDNQKGGYDEMDFEDIEIYNDSKTANPYNKYKGIGKNEPIRNFNWDKAQKEFKLLNDFLTCSRKINHLELLGLLSGMIRIEGGVKKWKNAIESNCNIDNEKLRIYNWFEYILINGKRLWEIRIDRYAPNDPICQSYNRLTEINFRKGMPAKLMHSDAEISEDEAKSQMHTFINQSLNEYHNGVYVLKAASGLGKTESLTNVNLNQCIIAVPTHELKLELSQRLTEAGITHHVTPELPQLPDCIDQIHKSYQQVGDYKGAASFLKNLSVRSIDSIKIDETTNIQDAIKYYFYELDKCNESSYPVLTTHMRILVDNFPNHKTIIFDEDPLSSLTQSNRTTTHDIKKILGYLDGEDRKCISELLDTMSNPMSLPHYNDTLPQNTKDRIIKLIRNNINQFNNAILAFFDCDIWMSEPNDRNDNTGDYTIHFLRKHELPKDKKIIVLSATAQRRLYEMVFGDIQFKDISHVEHTGRRIQYSDLSFSRSTMSNHLNSNKLEKIRYHINDTPVITFHKYKNNFPNNDTEIHFGNCSGYDRYKGRDIAVVGTPHVPKARYLLLAKSIGMDYTEEDTQMRECEVEHNGYHFKIMTFANPDLRTVQFYLIESELLQACGRNRTIREYATTTLFSNYPLPGFEQRSTKELPNPSDDDNVV